MRKAVWLALGTVVLAAACHPTPPPQAPPPAALDIDLEGITKQPWIRVLVVQDDQGTFWAFRPEGVLEIVGGVVTLADGAEVATANGGDDPDVVAGDLMAALHGGGGFYSATTNADGRLVGSGAATAQRAKGNVVLRVRRLLRPHPCASDDGCKGRRVCRRGACLEATPTPASAPTPGPAEATPAPDAGAPPSP